MVGGWLRRSAVVQLTCCESAVCCTCASVARVADLPNLHNSLQLAMVGSREPAPAAGGHQGQPGRSGSQIRINPRPCLPSRRQDAGTAPARRRRGAPGAKGTPPGGLQLAQRWGHHHITRPKNEPAAHPQQFPPFVKTEKKFALRLPGFHCGSGCIAACRRCGWGNFWVGSLWLPVERSEWL